MTKIAFGIPKEVYYKDQEPGLWVRKKTTGKIGRLQGGIYLIIATK